MPDSPAPPMQTETSGRSRPIARPAKLIALGLLLIAALWLGAAYWRSKNEVDRLKRASQTAEIDRLLATIGQHVELPKERPVVATVEAKHNLAHQPFFKQAKNGDRVLMYAKHKKAILYRPSIDKIIEVATYTTKLKE